MRPNKYLERNRERISLEGSRSHSEVYPGLERWLLDRVLPQRQDERPPGGLTTGSVTSPIDRLGCAAKGL
jgi:hypothetical protein